MTDANMPHERSQATSVQHADRTRRGIHFRKSSVLPVIPRDVHLQARRTDLHQSIAVDAARNSTLM